MGSSMCTPVVDSTDEEKPMIRNRRPSIEDVSALSQEPVSLELLPFEKEQTLVEYFLDLPCQSSFVRTEKGLLLSVILLRIRRQRRSGMKKMTILQPCRLHKINESPLQDLRESLYVNSSSLSKCKSSAKTRAISRTSRKTQLKPRI